MPLMFQSCSQIRLVPVSYTVLSLRLTSAACAVPTNVTIAAAAAQVFKVFVCLPRLG